MDARTPDPYTEPAFERRQLGRKVNKQYAECRVRLKQRRS